MLNAPKCYPCLSYRDADAAITFLTTAFGFTEHMVHRDEQGIPQHVELALGSEILMLGTAKPELGWVSPLDLPARNATLCYGVTGDIDAAFDRAVAAGATVVRAPYDTSYGAREWSVRDPEGHEWHFGSYRPTVTDAPAT
jgi:uncharacterized glyoxalase superfamily protein PhnB